MIDQILKLQALGHSIRKIAKSLGLSRNTVRRYVRDAEEAASRNAEVHKSEPAKPLWMAGLPWDDLRMKRRMGITAKQLYAEYEPAISYSRFCFQMRQAEKGKPEILPRIVHVPGEKIYIDFCDGIAVVDPKTGKKRSTELFVGVLPFSSYTFAIFTWDQSCQASCAATRLYGPGWEA
jgi:transposase